MSQFAELLLILAAIYLSECGFYLRKSGVALATLEGLRFRPRGPAFLIGSGSGGICPLSPLPWTTAFIAEIWPVSLAPDGAFAYVAQALGSNARPMQSEKFFAWDEIKTIASDGADVHVNGSIFVIASTPAKARQLVALMKKLRAARTERRAAIIDAALDESLSVPAAQRALRRERRTLNRLRIAAAVLFAVVFILMPLGYSFLPLRLWAPPLAILAIFTIDAIVRLYRRATHRSLRHRRAERRKHSIIMCLAPTVAMRAATAASREVLACFHPLAVVRVLSAPRVFEEFVRQVAIDARFPIEPPCPSEEPAKVQAERWFREHWSGAVSRFLPEVGIDAELLLQPPPPESPTSQCYCPRCLTQYTHAADRCASCNIALVSFAPAIPSPTPQTPAIQAPPPQSH